MRGAPEPYVPGRPSPGEDGPADEGPWPPRIYVPGPGPDREERSGRLREKLLAAAGEGLDPRDDGACALALFRDPGLADEVLRMLEAELRDRGADTVAAVGPGGRMVGAALADRAGRPLAAVRTAAEPGEGEEAGVAGGPVSDGVRILLVAAAVADGEPVRTAARTLEAAGGSVVGVAAVVDAGNPPGASGGRAAGGDVTDDHNFMSIMEL